MTTVPTYLNPNNRPPKNETPPKPETPPRDLTPKPKP